MIKAKILSVIMGMFVFSLVIAPVDIAGAAQCNNGETIPEGPPTMSEIDRNEAYEAFCSTNARGGVATSAVNTNIGQSCDLDNSILGIPTWYKYLNAEFDSTGKCSVMLSGSDAGGKANSALPIGIAILEAMLRISGLVAVVMIFIGSFKYITSLGSPDSAKSARTTIINAVIGLVIVIVSTVVVSFIGGIVR